MANTTQGTSCSLRKMDQQATIRQARIQDANKEDQQIGQEVRRAGYRALMSNQQSDGVSRRTGMHPRQCTTPAKSEDATPQ